MEYVADNSGSMAAFEGWLTKLELADWETSNEIKQTYGSADLLGSGTSRVVFDIGGNNYRMICKYGFGATQVHLFVCWIGTHAEYTKLCEAGEQYTINLY